MLGTVLASLLPVFDLRTGRPADALLHEAGEAGQRIDKRATAAGGLLGLILLIAVTLLVLLVPSLSILGGVVLALAASA